MLFHTKVCATTLRLKVYSPEHTHSVILWAHSWNKTFFYVSCHMWHTLCSIKHIKHMLKWAYLVWHTFNILIKVHLNLTIDVLKRVYLECTLKDVINKNYFFLKLFLLLFYIVNVYFFLLCCLIFKAMKERKKEEMINENFINLTGIRTSDRCVLR